MLDHQPEGYVATEYSQVTAIKNILETPGSQTQFDVVEIRCRVAQFAYNELEIDYPCPVADVAEGFEEKVPQAGWIVHAPCGVPRATRSTPPTPRPSTR